MCLLSITVREPFGRRKRTDRSKNIFGTSVIGFVFDPMDTIPKTTKQNKPFL